MATIRKDQLKESMTPIRTLVYPSISPWYFYTVFNTLCLAPHHLSSTKAPPLDLKKAETQKCTHNLVLMINYSHCEKEGGEVLNFLVIWLHLSANFLFCLSTQIKQRLVLGIFLLKSCSSTVAKSPLRLHFGKSNELSCLNISHCLA